MLLLVILSCGRVGEAPDVLCPDGWRRPPGECPEPEPVDSEDSAEPCEIGILRLDPDEGEEHYRRSPVRAILDGEPDAAQIRVEGAEGESVRDGPRVTWTPSEPLEFDTSFDAVVEHTCGKHEWSFRTGALGEPRTEEIVGRTYVFDAESAEVIVPEGSALEPYLDRFVFVQVLEHDGESLTLLIAHSELDDASQQYLCNPTLQVDADFEDDPWFHVPRQRAGLGPLIFEELEISGSFSADASQLGGLAVDAVVDTRELAFLVGEEEGQDAICKLVAGVGIECMACSDGEELCMELVTEGGSASAVELDLFPIETCDDSCTEQECDGCGCSSKRRGGAWLLGLLSVLLLGRRVADSAP